MIKNKIAIMLLAFLVGFVSDRIYMNYKLNSFVNAERELWKKYVNENEINILNNSYGTIVISSSGKDRSSAEIEMTAKIGLAKLYKWSLVGEKKTESIDGQYKISQTVFRLFIE